MPKPADRPCHSKSPPSEHQIPPTSLQAMPVADRKRAATHAKPGPFKPAKKFCYYPKAAESFKKLAGEHVRPSPNDARSNAAAAMLVHDLFDLPDSTAERAPPSTSPTPAVRTHHLATEAGTAREALNVVSVPGDATKASSGAGQQPSVEGHAE
eukprot:scaffold70939_cov16-Prasinocladus_malaysianus.AAC.1